VHVVNEPVPLDVSVIVPCGVLGVPAAVSVTVTVQLTELFTAVLAGLQEIVVLVDR
jgi:hypothetical protein